MRPPAARWAAFRDDSRLPPRADAHREHAAAVAARDAAARPCRRRPWSDQRAFACCSSIAIPPLMEHVLHAVVGTHERAGTTGRRNCREWRASRGRSHGLATARPSIISAMHAAHVGRHLHPVAAVAHGVEKAVVLARARQAVGGHVHEAAPAVVELHAARARETRSRAIAAGCRRSSRRRPDPTSRSARGRRRSAGCPA